MASVCLLTLYGKPQIEPLLGVLVGKNIPILQSMAVRIRESCMISRFNRTKVLTGRP